MPSAKDKLLSMYQQSPESFGEVLTGDPGSAPAGLAGLVMNPKNAKKIADKLTEFIIKRGGQRFSGADYALAYLSAKYPKLIKIPASFDIRAKLPSHITGHFQSIPNKILVNTKYAERSVGEGVNTLAHELTHALQQSKGATFKDYVKLGKRGQNADAYYNQLVEIQARKSGSTAQNTFEKFLELIK